MNKKFSWAVALYVISFFMPVISGFGFPERTIWGWEVVQEIIFPADEGLFASEKGEVFYYIIANIPNPFIITVIILRYLKKGSTSLIYILSLIALITALLWSPFFFTLVLTNFDIGYWLWLLGIVLIYFYANDGSIKRPSKRVHSASPEK